MLQKQFSGDNHRNRVTLCVSAVFAVGRCPSVCISLCLFVRHASLALEAKRKALYKSTAATTATTTSPIAYVAENREVCDVQYRKVAAGLTWSNGLCETTLETLRNALYKFKTFLLTLYGTV